MAEYIERETIKAAMIHYGFKSPDMTVTEFVEDELPAADVAPVVHCKDCKHLMFSDCYGECGAARMGIVSPDDFCSYGERKCNATD